MQIKRRGFTMIELLIGLAIGGLLVAIALTQFSNFRNRTRRAEIPLCVNGIQTSELAYEHMYDNFMEQASYLPDSNPLREPRHMDTTSSGFATIGWEPDGEVRGSYKVTTISDVDFITYGISDVDGDAERATFTATRSINSYQVTDDAIY